MSRDEALVKEYLEGLGLDVERISAGGEGVKTPDLRVFRKGFSEALCEVKSISERRDRDGQDSTFNRLAAHIHLAVKQLVSANPSAGPLNLVAIVNHEPVIDERDLIGALTGTFYTDRGKLHPTCKYVEGRIKEDASNVDAYLWFQEGEKHPFTLFNQHEQERFLEACGLLDVDPDSVFPMGD